MQIEIDHCDIGSPCAREQGDRKPINKDADFYLEECTREQIYTVKLNLWRKPEEKQSAK